MRRQVVSMELAATESGLEDARDKRRTTRLVLHHLQDERDRVRDQIKRLQAELLLIDEQIDTKEAAGRQLATVEADLEARAALLRRTLPSIEREAHKSRLIVESLAPGLDLSLLTRSSDGEPELPP